MKSVSSLRSVADLRKYMDAGNQPDFLFFWGHRPGKPGVGYKSCLSQWFEAPFEVDGIEYPTAEHYMMAGKARLFNDTDALRAVLAAGSPGAAKAAGRAVRGFDENRWRQYRWDIVVNANVAKFSQHADLKQYLLGTGDQVLVEASPLDFVWGIGLAADDPDAPQPARWQGLNLLGFVLMEVREQLRLPAPD